MEYVSHTLRVLRICFLHCLGEFYPCFSLIPFVTFERETVKAFRRQVNHYREFVCVLWTPKFVTFELGDVRRYILLSRFVVFALHVLFGTRFRVWSLLSRRFLKETRCLKRLTLLEADPQWITSLQRAVWVSCFAVVFETSERTQKNTFLSAELDRETVLNRNWLAQGGRVKKQSAW